MKRRIYIIDDDKDMVRILSDLLLEEDYLVDWETDPAAGLASVQKNPPDLLLLDIRMKGMDGLKVCQEVKGNPRSRHVPVVMLSVRADEADVVVGLEMGAEDYIRKPIRRRELLARVKTALRRKETGSEPEKFVLGPLKIDHTTFSAAIHGKPLDLRPKEFELLAYLAHREGQVVTRQKIAENVWKREHLPGSQTIEFHVHQLRGKLGSYESWIKSLRGIGYKFEIPDS